MKFDTHKWIRQFKTDEINKSGTVTEGFMDMFTKLKKAQKAPSNKYNPDNIGYGHPDFKKVHKGFSPDPEAEIQDVGKKQFKLNKQILPLISSYLVEEEHMLEMMTQQDMVNGDKANVEYIKLLKAFIKELKSVELQMRHGVW